MSSKNIQFDQLPPRVIIHDILTFYEIVINKYEAKRDSLLLFGYFKNDKMRNIWFVFTSIKFSILFGSKRFPKELILNIQKVFALNCRGNCGTFNQFVRRIVHDSSKMFSLRSLNLFLDGNDSRELFGEILMNSKFPNLEYFFGGRNFIGLSDFQVTNIDTNFLTKLKSLTLLNILISFENEKLPNLKKLSLCSFFYENEVEFEIPNLEVLKLARCYNLAIIPSSNRLRKLVIELPLNHRSHSDYEKILKPILPHSKNLKELELREGELEDDLFSTINFQHIEQLEELRLCWMKEIQGVGWCQKMCENLKMLEIRFCQKFDDSLFQENSFPKLKILHLIRLQKVEKKNWKEMQNLEILNMVKCGNKDESDGETN